MRGTAIKAEPGTFARNNFSAETNSGASASRRQVWGGKIAAISEVSPRSPPVHGDFLQSLKPKTERPASIEAGRFRLNPKVLFGGAREDRTPDLLNAIQALSHLSYDPTGEKHRVVTFAMPGV
jgi:hypothetical protein